MLRASLGFTLAATLLSATASAQPELRFSSIDGGVERLAGGSFTLIGTVGQHDAQVSSGGTLDLRGGFYQPPLFGGCNDADLAQPFGILDLTDVDAFVAAFLPGLPAADLNGDGIIDLTDIDLFVTAFLVGCL